MRTCLLTLEIACVFLSFTLLARGQTLSNQATGHPKGGFKR
jgi:hypothetical protein